MYDNIYKKIGLKPCKSILEHKLKKSVKKFFKISVISSFSPNFSLFSNCNLNEKTFNNFVKELERKGIVDDELSDGFEFIGGPKGFHNYIEANAARLVIELGGELDLQEKQNSEAQSGSPTN